MNAWRIAYDYTGSVIGNHDAIAIAVRESILDTSDDIAWPRRLTVSRMADGRFLLNMPRRIIADVEAKTEDEAISIFIEHLGLPPRIDRSKIELTKIDHVMVPIVRRWEYRTDRERRNLDAR